MTIISSRLAALAAAVLLAACQPAGQKFKGTDVTGAQFGRELALTGHDGRPRTLGDFRGKAVVVSFGFTHCPDVCPTTLADLAGVVRRLGRDAERVQVLLVTVDPERDSAEVLGKYLAAFDPRFLGLTGDAEATTRAAKEFKVYYEKRASGHRHKDEKSGPEHGYTVDHSAQVFVLDPKGRLRLLLKSDRIVADLADDLRALLQE